MRKLFVSLMLVLGLSASAYSQGTVAFQNYTTGTVLGVVYDATYTNMTSFTTAPFIGPIHLELFYGPVGDTLAQLLALNNGLVFSTTISPAAAGHFSDSTVAVTTGPAGSGSADPTQNIELAIAGWKGDYATYQADLISPDDFSAGVTAAFSNPTGGGGVPQASPANLVGWLASNPLILDTFIPEPGTIALGALGGAMLLLFRRRK